MRPLRTRAERDALNLGLEGLTGRTKKVPGYGVFFKVQTSCSQLTEMGHANYSTTSSVSKHNNLTLPLLLTRTQSFSQVISTSMWSSASKKFKIKQSCKETEDYIEICVHAVSVKASHMTVICCEFSAVEKRSVEFLH